MIAASRPSTSPSASITTHFLSISDGFAENVFIPKASREMRGSLAALAKGRSCKRSARRRQGRRSAGPAPRPASSWALPRALRKRESVRPQQIRSAAMSAMALMAELGAALGAAGGDRQVRVVVIAGAGPAFYAGHDLRELRADPRRQTYERIFSRCSELMLQIVRLPKPVIAEVHGVATAA